jgi:hypothetical protein
MCTVDISGARYVRIKVHKRLTSESDLHLYACVRAQLFCSIKKEKIRQQVYTSPPLPAATEIFLSYRITASALTYGNVGSFLFRTALDPALDSNAFLRWSVRSWGAASLCCCAAVLPCCRAAVLLCCRAAVLPCCRAAVLPCCRAAVLPCCCALLLE